MARHIRSVKPVVTFHDFLHAREREIVVDVQVRNDIAAARPIHWRRPSLTHGGRSRQPMGGFGLRQQQRKEEKQPKKARDRALEIRMGVLVMMVEATRQKSAIWG